MIKKVLGFIYSNFIGKLFSARQKQIIKNHLTTDQKKFLLKLLRLESSSRKKANRQIKMIAGRLYKLGFTERPLADLHGLLDDNSTPMLQELAARELARWYANQKSKEGVNQCLKLLSTVKKYESNTVRIRQNAIIEAECHEKLDNVKIGKRAIRNALKQIGPEENLYLAAANFEKTLSGRISWINKTLVLQGISPVSYDLQAEEPSFECIKPWPTKEESGYQNNMPLVSVIMPAYNAQNTIGHALDSILAQTWANLEIYVVDDCSEDDTVSVIKEYMQKDSRIKLIEGEANGGPYIARNLALSALRGDFVTTHDTDDWSHPEKIERQAVHLIENPAVMGNTSQMALTYPDLKFYRGYNFGNLVFTFISSFMFRRKPVINAIGFWDQVRFGADNEYIRRIKKVFGENSVINIPTGPLSFYRKGAGSLTGDQAFGHPGFYMGVRNEYYEAQSYYHEKAESLYYDFPQQERPFPVPEPMWTTREKVDTSGRRHFDVILASDFRMLGGSVNSSVEEIKAQKKTGIRTGLIQMHWYNLEPDRVILPQVREQIDGALVQMLVYGEKVSCDLLIVRYPPVLMEKQRYIPDVEARDVRVIVNQPPMRDYGIEGLRRYYIQQCHHNVNDYFGKAGIWHPNSPLVREALYEKHLDELQTIAFSEEDWLNIIDVQQWKRASRPPAADHVRIGRHSRDHFVKWPSDKDVLLSVYPDHGDYKVHVLGGAKTPLQILGYLPRNWQVWEFNQVPPLKFLADLDVFIYFTHPDWVESFPRTVIEAMAVGVPVILPPLYKKLFEDAAIYAEPHEVKFKISELMSDEKYYEARVQKALNHVSERFGYPAHAGRVEKILGRKLKIVENKIDPGYTTATPELKNSGAVNDQWKNEVKSSVKFYEKRLLGGHLDERLNPERELKKEVIPYLDEGKITVKILDVGSGPVTCLGYRWKDKKVVIEAVDVNADEYRKLFVEHKVNLPVAPTFCEAERLTGLYKPETFDFVYSRNAIDHCYDPVKAINQMTQMVKPGCYVLLQHFLNEGKKQGYKKAHLWNFDIEDGEVIIYNPVCKYFLSQELGEGIELSFKLSGWLYVELYKKPGEQVFNN